MMPGHEVLLCLLFTFFLVSDLAVARAVPSVLPAYHRPASDSIISSSTPSTSDSSQIIVTPGVAQQHPHTGHNYALDPIGFLGSTLGDGNSGDDGPQAKETRTNKPSQTTSSAMSASTSKMMDSNTNTSPSAGTDTSGSGSAAHPKTTEASSSEFRLSTTYLSGTMSATSTSSVPPGLPSQINSKGGNDASSGSSMNAWKIIGIGVLAFTGIVTLVVCTAFQDTILRAISGPFQRRKGQGEEVLVPDWRRGSWRFGEDGESTPTSSLKDDDGPRIGEGEKGSLVVPLPPISPFPMRRTLSTPSDIPAEPSLAGIGARKPTIKNVSGNNPVLPTSAPSRYMPQPPRNKKCVSKAAFSNSPEQEKLDAYGGMA